MLLVLATTFALLVGLTLGLLGGGGSILTLPLLVYLLEMEEKQGVAGSLFVVALTSLVAMSAHARRGVVQWKTGLLFGAVGMVGAYLAGRIAAWIPGSYLLIGFGVVALASALAMMRGRRERPPREGPLPIAQVVALGLIVGGISGLVGAGGGFLIVPALTLLGGLAIAEAIGTSLLVISMQSMAGFAGHAAHVSLDWQLLSTVTGAAIIGSVLGSQLGKRLSAAALRQSFAWLILFMGAFILTKETPSELLEMPATRAGGALAFLAVVGLAVRNFRLGRAARRELRSNIQNRGTKSLAHASTRSTPADGTRRD